MVTAHWNVIRACQSNSGRCLHNSTYNSYYLYLYTKYNLESGIIRFCINCWICRYQIHMALLHCVLLLLGNCVKYSEMFPLWGAGTKWGLWAAIPFYSRGSVFNCKLWINLVYQTWTVLFYAISDYLHVFIIIYHLIWSILHQAE